MRWVRAMHATYKSNRALATTRRLNGMYGVVAATTHRVQRFKPKQCGTFSTTKKDVPLGSGWSFSDTPARPPPRAKTHHANGHHKHKKAKTQKHKNTRTQEQTDK
jgi:hypothetical protein